MAADISQSLKDWSATPASNLPTGATAVGPNLDDNLRNLQAAVRADLGSRDTIASAATTDIGTKDAGGLDVTGTTTITSLGTLTAGLRKTLTFGGALTLTHNATSLILPGGTNITTAAGDNAEFVSLGSGNWRCLWYAKASGAAVSSSFALPDGTAAAPGLSFALDSNTGLYRIGADNIGVALGGSKLLDISASTLTFLGGGATYMADFNSLFRVRTSGLLYGTPSSAGASTGGSHNITCQAANSNFDAGGFLVNGSDGAGTGQGSKVELYGGGGTVKGWAALYGSSLVISSIKVSDTLGVVLGGSVRGVVDTKHLYVDNTNGTPSLGGTGGAGATIAGSDTAFEVTLGTGSPTSFTATFANSHASAPQVVLANTTQAGCRLNYAVTTGTVQILSDVAWSSGAKVSVLVLGLQ